MFVGKILVCVDFLKIKLVFAVEAWNCKGSFKKNISIKASLTKNNKLCEGSI